MRKLTAADVTFYVQIEPEDIEPEGNAIVSGDDDFDKEVIDGINERLRDGDLWAWGCVKVGARWKDWTGVAYLGCCSYENEEGFKKDGYFEQMKKEALDDLNSTVAKVFESVKELQE